MIPEIRRGIMAKPLEDPHPPIVAAAVAPFSKGVTAAAERGWDPISATFPRRKRAATHWPRYAEGCEAGGRMADPTNRRAALGPGGRRHGHRAGARARGRRAPIASTSTGSRRR